MQQNAASRPFPHQDSKISRPGLSWRVLAKQARAPARSVWGRTHCFFEPFFQPRTRDQNFANQTQQTQPPHHLRSVARHLPRNSSHSIPRQSHIMDEEISPSIHTKEVTRLWRSWRTIHEMVQDRVRDRRCPRQDRVNEQSTLTSVADH